jgi:hypothetical protein
MGADDSSLAALGNAEATVDVEGGSDRAEAAEETDGLPILDVFFVDDHPEDHSRLDDRLVFAVSRTDGDLEVYQCECYTYFPASTNHALYIYESGDVISRDQAAHQTHYCKLLPRTVLGDGDHNYAEIPEALREVELPVGGDWSDEELEYLTLSIAASRARDGELSDGSSLAGRVKSLFSG